MSNYIKSEFFRISRDKGVYNFVFIFAALAVLLNVVLWSVKQGDEFFPYGTTSFTYSTLVSSLMLFCVMGAAITMLLYDGNLKNGNLKNSIGFGISRTKICVGQFIVSSIVATISMMIIMMFYISSAVVLLEHTGPVALSDLLTGVIAVYFSAIASVILANILIVLSGKTSTGIGIWFVIWFVIPSLLLNLGLLIKNEVIRNIAMYFPANIFSSGNMLVNTTQCITAWNTPELMSKCIVVGILASALFSIIGISILRRKEV